MMTVCHFSGSCSIPRLYNDGGFETKYLSRWFYNSSNAQMNEKNEKPMEFSLVNKSDIQFIIFYNLNLRNSK